MPRRAPRLLRNLPETTCQALEGLMGVSCMAEDVLILGVGDTLDKATFIHVFDFKKVLHQLMLLYALWFQEYLCCVILTCDQALFSFRSVKHSDGKGETKNRA